MKIILIDKSTEYYSDVSNIHVRDGVLSFYCGYKKQVISYPLASILKWENP